MTDTSIIWKTDQNNLWRLFINTDYQPPTAIPAKDSKDKKPNTLALGKPQLPSSFTFNKSRPLIKGSMVCTSKGYGIIQNLTTTGTDVLQQTISVKIDGQIYEFNEEEVMNEIPVSIVVLHSSLKFEQTVFIPIYSTINEMVERLEGTLSDENSHSSVSLFYQGKELESSTETVEKLKIMPGTKVLGVAKLRTPMTVKRYTTTAGGWNLVANNVVGVSLNPSKTIKVIGFGLYPPSQGVMEGTASYNAGASIKRDQMFSKNFTFL